MKLKFRKLDRVEFFFNKNFFTKKVSKTKQLN